jgi:glutathione peroxidase
MSRYLRQSLSNSPTKEHETFYKLNAKDINGNVFEFSKLMGKIVLIVNVASNCGFTTNHYEQLVDLKRLWAGKDFEILAFPCNQFGEQEPGTNEAIKVKMLCIYSISIKSS